MGKRLRQLITFVAGATLLASLGIAATPMPAESTGGLKITTLSSLPEAVSGDRALIRIDVAAGTDTSEITVTRDGSDITAKFRADSGGLLGMVDGLDPGRHRIEASAPGIDGAEVDLTAHPITGPVFSGPHEQPFACETAEYTSPAGHRLGDPGDADCSLETRVEYLYRTTGGEFTELPDPNAHPDDLATTTTLDGNTVPYIVRVEIGTVNRGIYEIASLHDPATEPEPTAFTHSNGWNERLIYTFGGGCRRGWYQQGAGTGGVMIDSMLSRGFAVASNSLNVFGNNCSDLLTSETLSMTREHFIESYGEPTYTMGWGCSGGSYQAHQAADAYPGLLDGIIVGCSFPDVGFGTSQKLADARLLNTYFTGDAPGADGFSADQRLAVSGFGVETAIGAQSNGAQRMDPDAEFDASTAGGLRYDADTNPTGARGTIWDHTRNAYGVDPETGFALRPLDNVGVQYGLGALQDGTIVVDQFLDLNAAVGGFDIDAEPTKQRTHADAAARQAAYQTGRMLDGGGGLARTPIIDYRAYTDDLAQGDIHMRYQSFSTRDRLIEANGDADNQVMLVQDNSYGGFDAADPVLVQAIEQMDQWILSIKTDESGADPHQVVVANKPAELVDACWTPGRINSPAELESNKVVEEIQADSGRCHELYPTYASPRIVAGGPMASDVITCQLTGPDRRDYPALSGAQWRRLQTVFDDGVCDYSKPGVDETPMGGTWASFSGPGAWTFLR